MSESFAQSEDYTDNVVCENDGSNAQHINLEKSSNKSRTTREKRYDVKHDDEHTLTNSSDIKRIDENNQKLSLTSYQQQEGDQCCRGNWQHHAARHPQSCSPGSLGPRD